MRPDRWIALLYVTVGLLATPASLYGALLIVMILSAGWESGFPFTLYSAWLASALTTGFGVGYALFGLTTLALWKGRARPALWYANAAYTLAVGATFAWMFVLSGSWLPALGCLGVWGLLASPAGLRGWQLTSAGSSRAPRVARSAETPPEGSRC